MHAISPTEALARDLTPAMLADQSIAVEPPDASTAPYTYVTGT